MQRDSLRSTNCFISPCNVWRTRFRPRLRIFRHFKHRNSYCNSQGSGLKLSRNIIGKDIPWRIRYCSLAVIHFLFSHSSWSCYRNDRSRRRRPRTNNMHKSSGWIFHLHRLLRGNRIRVLNAWQPLVEANFLPYRCHYYFIFILLRSLT